MRQPDISIQFSRGEVVLEYQAKSFGAVRHVSIIASAPRLVRYCLALMSYQSDPLVAGQPAPPPLELPHYGISFGGAVARGFKKYATFRGRAGRGEYWWWTLFTFLSYLVFGLLVFAVGMATSRDGGRTPGLLAVPLIILFAVFFLGLVVPTLALTVRRLHDAGYSGLLALLMLIPYLGSLIILIFALLPSSPAGAKYDPILYNP
jgi:uncharacterized membrane protein YhaH (DUF805 family)